MVDGIRHNTHSTDPYKPITRMTSIKCGLVWIKSMGLVNLGMIFIVVWKVLSVGMSCATLNNVGANKPPRSSMI